MRHIFLPLFAVMTILLASCQKEIKELMKPQASGTPYDLYLVMNQDMRGTALHDTLLSVFEYPMANMPSSDSYFRVRHLTPEHFSSPIIRTVANVVMIDIASDNSEMPVMTLEHNLYAQHQLIMRMHAKSTSSLAEYLSQLQEQLRDVFVRNEINRRIEMLQEGHQTRQQERLMAMQDVSMLLPPSMAYDCHAAQDPPHFFWATDGYEEKTSYIVVYSIPYTDDRIFSLEGALSIRDSIMGANITAGEGEFVARMTTRREIVVPQYRALAARGHYIGELTGMWRIPGQLMAGPFICHIRLDELNQRVVFAEGFCYAPKVQDKRLMMRNLEATLYTLRLPSDNVLQEIEVTL